MALVGGVAFATGMMLSYLQELNVVQVPARGAVFGILIPTGVICTIFVGVIAYDGLYGKHTAITDRGRLRWAVWIAVAVTIWGTVHTVVKVLGELA